MGWPQGGAARGWWGCRWVTPSAEGGHLLLDHALHHALQRLCMGEEEGLAVGAARDAARRARRWGCQWGCRQWGCRQWGSAHAHTHLVLQDRFELHLEDKVQLARARLAAVGEAPARAQVAEQVGVGRDRGHAARRLQCDAARVRLGEGEEAERERRVEASWSVARADARGRAKRKELRVPLHVGHHSIDLLARVGHTLLALQGVQSGREELAVRSSWHASTRVARPPQHAAWEAPPADDFFAVGSL